MTKRPYSGLFNLCTTMKIKDNMEKPKLGVMPERIWKEKRLEDLRRVIGEAISDRNRIVPAEWTDEFNRLLVDIYGPVNKVSFTKPTNKIPPKKKLIDIDSILSAAGCFDASMVLKNHYNEQFNVIPVGRTEEVSGPITLQLEIDTSSIENFLKGVSFGIKLKK